MNYTTRTVHVAVYDGLADWEIGFVTAAINDPQFQDRPGSFQVATVGETREPITTMGGLRVLPDLTLDELDVAHTAMLILPGSHGWNAANGGDSVPDAGGIDGPSAIDEARGVDAPRGIGGAAAGIDATRWLRVARSLLDEGTPVAGICGATLGLAGVGLLDDRDHTSSAPEYLATAAAYDGADHYIDADAVNDRGLITAGATDPLAFAREILAELGVYAPAVLEAWFRLYATHDPKYFFALMAQTHA